MKYYCSLLLVLLCLSCKKKEIITVNYRPPYDPSLRISHQENDSTLTLSWNKYTGKDFKSYHLIYGTTRFNGYSPFDEYIWYEDFTSADELGFKVERLPKTQDHFFILKVNLRNVEEAYIDTLRHVRPGIYLPREISDALIDRDRKIVYLMDMAKGQIWKTNYETGEELGSISLKSPLGQCALASYGGTLNELYVPTRDGFVFIVDATSMTIKERVYVQMPYPQIPLANDSVFYVNATYPYPAISQVPYVYDHLFVVYTRATLQYRIMGNYALERNARIHYLDGTNNEFVEIRIQPGYPPVKWYGYGWPYELVRVDKDLSPDIFCSFPGGQKYISGAEGVIFDGVFQREADLPGAKYANFTISENADVIYAARADSARVSVFSYPALSKTQEFKTRLLPFKMFLDGKQLICITRTSNFGTRSYSLIEKIDLP